MSRIKFLLDEHVHPGIAEGLRKRLGEVIVWRVGDPTAPPLGTPDPDILLWCEAHRFVLVTNNRASMPTHLAEHLEAGRHMPGILTLNPKMSIGEHIDELEYIWQVADPGEFDDVIWFLPIQW
jgi:hypothetical protein